MSGDASPETRAALERVRRHTPALRAFIADAFPACLREAEGALRHPFVDPGEGYRGILWDWDAYFCCVGLAPWAGDVATHAAGCVLNFLDFQGDDGHVPYSLTAKSTRPARRPDDAPQNSAKPLLARFTQLAVDYGADASLIERAWPALARHVEHWRATQEAPNGLLTFRSHRGSGADNYPAVYGRPFDSSADVFLNSLMVRELEAMADLAARLGRDEDAAGWRGDAEALAGRIRRLMWDPIDGCFYNLDVGRGDAGRVNQEVTWAVPLKFRGWQTAMPLWAGAATAEQAERVVREHVMNPDELWSDHGLRSLARNEPAYAIFAGSNPSDWQGPIWVVSNYLAFAGLLRYGYVEEAARLAANLLETLARDLAATGALHEYYDPESGRGITFGGFLNWNTLAALFEDELARAATRRSSPPTGPAA